MGDAETLDWLWSDGEMGELIRAKDWAQTPLGPPSSWSPSLRMMVPFLLANRFPLLLWWGPDFCQIYNDAYRPVLGTKHPQFLGRPVRECWSEIWDILRPLIETPYNGGPATWMEDIHLEVNRFGFTEETHFTIAYSPVPDETVSGGIGGVLATVHEISEKVVGQRRLVILRDLSTQSLEAKTAEEACAIAATTLTFHPRDVPFAAFYLLDADKQQPRLAGSTDNMKSLASLLSVDASGDSIWPLKEITRTQKLILVDNLPALLGDALPAGPWSDPPQQAAVVPIRSTTPSQLAGILVLGISSRLRFDDAYRNFVDLAASQIATAIGNARAYEEERKRSEALAELDRAKTAFFSNVSHEFRTPLSLMLGPIDDVLSAGDLKPEVRDRLEVARRNSQRLHKLVNSLLDFSRIEAGRIEAVYEPVDIANLTAELASVFRSTIERAGLSLIVDCAYSGQLVYVDRDMWEKIVLNLLSNAFKFTFEGEIRVTLRASESGVELAVTDTGTGIPDNELPRVFERFHRVKNARGRSYEGSGIGLALVKELVKLHGGTVSVASQLNHGSRFKVSIPFGTSHLPADRIAASRTLTSTAVHSDAYLEEAVRWIPSESQPSFTRSDRKSQRIVLADDNSDMREYVRRLLNDGGYEVIAVADGEAALSTALSQKVDLILSDVMMPRLDGFALIAALRKDERTATTPVILLSARAGGESRVEGLDAGADDYLVKPFSARELIARVESHLKLAHLRQEEKNRATRDLAAMAALHDVGTRCARAGHDYKECLDAIVSTSVLITGADKANIQIVDESTGNLRIGAQQGFSKAFVSIFEQVKCDTQTRVIVEDIRNSTFVPASSRDALLSEGILAVQSSPLISSSGTLLGVISTHWTRTHSPTERDLRLLDLLVRQTADYIERRQADEALRSREFQLQTLFEVSPMGVYVVDSDFRLRQVNSTALPAFKTIPDLIGHDFDAVVHHLSKSRERANEIVAIFRRTLETGESYIAPERIDVRDDPEGTEYYEWRVDRIPLPDGRYGVVCHFRDVSAQVLARLENRRLYEREQRAREAAEQAALAKDEFLAMVSHELRSPLNAILGYNRVLRAKKPDDPDIAKAVDVIEQNGRAQVQLIEDLLDTARIISGKLKLEFRLVELTDVLAAAADSLRPTAESKGVTLTVDAKAEGFTIHGDANRLQQIVWNLLSNAIKFTPAGGRVRLHLERHLSFVRITVEDTGAGIREALLPYIFDRFRQGDSSSSRRFGGLGLGLALVKQLTELHGGKITAQSDGEGRGACFTVILPAPTLSAADVQRAAPDISARPPLRGIRVLIVDDDEASRETTALMLREYGLQATTVGSAEEAITTLEHTVLNDSSPFDLLLSDLGMPEEDGFDFIRKVRRHPDKRINGVRAIALTAYARAEDRIRALEAGYHMHSAKPVEERNLTAVIASLVGKNPVPGEVA
jgi:signal transduction histidine kinase/DNA-binding response OmpR family regulator